MPHATWASLRKIQTVAVDSEEYEIKFSASDEGENEKAHTLQIRREGHP